MRQAHIRVSRSLPGTGRSGRPPFPPRRVGSPPQSSDSPEFGNPGTCPQIAHRIFGVRMRGAGSSAISSPWRRALRQAALGQRLHAAGDPPNRGTACGANAMPRRTVPGALRSALRSSSGSGLQSRSITFRSPRSPLLRPSTSRPWGLQGAAQASWDWRCRLRAVPLKRWRANAGPAEMWSGRAGSRVTSRVRSL